MRYLNRSALGALTALGLIASGGAAAQQRPAGAPSVAPVGDATPPANLPTGAGPSGTSSTVKGPARFDRVGYAAIAGDSAHDRIAAWGAGLPASGFAEVTDLATGRTVLVKTADKAAERAGYLVDLSPSAAQLLGLSGSAPAKVRVRQVEPIAADQVALEQGRPASPRLDAPPILLNGLRAQLAAVPAPGAAVPKRVPAVTKTVGGAVPAATPRLKPPVTSPPAKAAPAKAAPAPKQVPAKKAASPVAAGKYRVQVAAFASQANAKGLAAKIGGHVIASGKYWRVELGPFAAAAAAKRARDGVAKRGYGDARVITD